MKRLQTVSESIKKRVVEDQVTGNAPEGVEEAGEQRALSMDLTPAQFNVALKQALKAKGITAKVSIGNSYKWPDCNVYVHGDMPNELRKEVTKIVAPTLKTSGATNAPLHVDSDNIGYGNVHSNYITIKAKDWVTAMENYNP